MKPNPYNLRHDPRKYTEIPTPTELEELCQECEGYGFVEIFDRPLDPAASRFVKCEVCNGSGLVPKHKCVECGEPATKDDGFGNWFCAEHVDLDEGEEGMASSSLPEAIQEILASGMKDALLRRRGEFGDRFTKPAPLLPSTTMSSKKVAAAAAPVADNDKEDQSTAAVTVVKEGKKMPSSIKLTDLRKIIAETIREQLGGGDKETFETTPGINVDDVSPTQARLGDDVVCSEGESTATQQIENDVFVCSECQNRWTEAATNGAAAAVAEGAAAGPPIPSSEEEEGEEEVEGEEAFADEDELSEKQTDYEDALDDGNIDSVVLLATDDPASIPDLARVLVLSAYEEFRDSVIEALGAEDQELAEQLEAELSQLQSVGASLGDLLSF